MKSIGRVSNLNGWKVGIPEYKGQDSMGTGTVIGAHTLSQMDMLLMINMVKLQHQNIKFQLNRNGKSIPYTFHANEVIRYRNMILR